MLKDSFQRFVFLVYGSSIAALFILSIAVRRGDDVIFINGLHNAGLDGFFVFITNLGDGLIFLPVMLWLAFYRVEYSITALMAWILHGLLSTFLKRVVFDEQLRPREVISNDQLYFVPGVEVHSYFSFPSGHTMTIFCATFILSLVIRSRVLTIVLLLVALAVGCSRIYLLQHFLIDVAGGALIGVLSAYVAWLVTARMKKPAWMQRRINLR